jgi:hypothetical protein
MWLAAAALARDLGVPLHLVLHDDWPSTITSNRPGAIGNAKRWFCRRVLGRVYRQAASRLCVSPGMEEHYRAWFGCSGRVLYPSRGEDSPIPRVRVRPGIAGPPTVAYCGLVSQYGTGVLLGQVAAVLARLGGYLDLYTPYEQATLATMGLEGPNIRHAGFLRPQQLAETLARTAHALFLPASFEPRERDDVATLFPSKLADYTAMGLPILVWAPAYSSAARWAAENPGATVCITEPDAQAVERALEQLANVPEYAASVAAAGTEAGRRYFELAAARDEFFRALSQTNERWCD